MNRQSKKHLALLLAFLVPAFPIAALAAPAVGDYYKITREVQRENKSDTSSGSSFDRDTITVRVVSAHDGGLELEYDMLPAASEKERQSEWQLPARIFVPANGEPQLLNAPELTKRSDAWLAKAGWTHEICGQWIFTWNAFKIECDPQSVLGLVKDYGLQPADLRDGALYRHPGAGTAVPLHMTSTPSGGATYTATMPIDADQVRQSLAENDVIVAKITGKQLSEADAKATHATTQITGTINVTFEADSIQTVQRLTTVVKIKQTETDGKNKTSSSIETLTRSPL